VTAICGFLPGAADEAAALATVAAMARAQRVRREQQLALWWRGGLAVALLELPEGGEAAPSIEERYRPVASADGRHHLWFAGEVFDAGGRVAEAMTASASRTAAFRTALLAALLAHGPEVLAQVDGEFHAVLWDQAERRLTLANDRFGGLPLYRGRSAAGFAFAASVRGVLAAPGISADPNPEALREAVTFGGYRLGGRTNVAAVKMLQGGSVLAVEDGGETIAPSWRFRDLAPVPERPLPELVEEADALWARAIERRLEGAKRPGQTLSGGLDSRAILAAAAPRAAGWTAITYGVPGCDDALYAERAARAAGARWVFAALYAGGTDGDWLDRRTAYVQATDGLIELVDLMHLETLPLQAELLDLHLSGYIGDAVAGPTFNDVTDAAGVLAALPYYGGRLGMPYDQALARAAALAEDERPAPARFAVFAHKLPQATNRWTAAWRPYFRVRKPFTDYALFDFFQGLPRRVRGEQALYARWLRRRWPALFARIPNQKTGLPVLASPLRVQAVRARRYAWRKAQPALAALGLPARPRQRAYSDDERTWREPSVRARIEATIRRPGALCREILGGTAVDAVLTDWFERGAAPAQVVGALYVYEAYHRDLGATIAAARREG